jgi:hypothetical protein
MEVLKIITVVFGLDFLIEEVDCESGVGEGLGEGVEDVEGVGIEFCEVLAVDLMVEELRPFD